MIVATKQIITTLNLDRPFFSDTTIKHPINMGSNVASTPSHNPFEGLVGLYNPAIFPGRSPKIANMNGKATRLPPMNTLDT